tara:strand:- start:146 stop:373 length:228 start_codon:yes stop_codon:yes gene_type:complete
MMKKKLGKRKKAFSKESFIQVFMPDLAKLSLSGKIIFTQKFSEAFSENYQICNCCQKIMGVIAFNAGTANGIGKA